MNTTATVAFLLASATATVTSAADSRIERLCGAGHQNEITSFDDVMSNPVGYYVVSLKEQISQGDPRIVLTNESSFHLCTRPAATPGMRANDVYRLNKTRAVKYLFVPIIDWSARSRS